MMHIVGPIFPHYPDSIYDVKNSSKRFSYYILEVDFGIYLSKYHFVPGQFTIVVKIG